MHCLIWNYKAQWYNLSTAEQYKVNSVSLEEWKLY